MPRNDKTRKTFKENVKKTGNHESFKKRRKEAEERKKGSNAEHTWKREEEIGKKVATDMVCDEP